MSSLGVIELEEKFIEIEKKCEKIINHLPKIKKVAKNREKMAEKLKAGPEKLVNDVEGPNLEFPLFKGKNGSSENRGTPDDDAGTSKSACGLSKKGYIIKIFDSDESDDGAVDISSWKCEEEAEPNCDSQTEKFIDSHEENVWTWMRPSFKGKKANLILYVKTSVLKLIKSKLGRKNLLEQFENSCFGMYLQYKTSMCPTMCMHMMLGQQVRRPEAGDDELWFRVGDQFLRFSKYEYALVTGLRFGNTDFDPNANYSYPKDGLFRRFIDPRGRVTKFVDIYDMFNDDKFDESPKDLLKVAKVIFVYAVLFGVDLRNASIPKWIWVLVEDEDKWENFPWGAYTFQILMKRLQSVPLEQPDGDAKFIYHLYGFSHAFMHWIIEAIPSFARILTVEHKAPRYQRPRLLKWPLRAIKTNDLHFFDDNTHIECHERLEPTPEELVDYSWWSHMADDVRSSVTYFHRKSTFKAAHKVSSSTIRPTVESLLHPSTSAPRVSHANQEQLPAEQSPQQHSRECGSLPQKRARTMDHSFDVHAHDYLLTQISDLVRRENALFIERVKQEITLFMERVKREKALLMERPNQENGLLTERLKQESGVLMERLKQENDLFTERLKHENALLMERLKREIEEQMRGNEAKDREGEAKN